MCARLMHGDLFGKENGEFLFIEPKNQTMAADDGHILIRFLPWAYLHSIVCSIA